MYGRPRASSFGGRQYVRRMKELRENELENEERGRMSKRKEVFVRYSSMPAGRGAGELRAFGDPPEVKELRRRKEPVCCDNRTTAMVKKTVTQLRDIDKQRKVDLEAHRMEHETTTQQLERNFSTNIPIQRDGCFGDSPVPKRSHSASHSKGYHHSMEYTALRGIDEDRRGEALKIIEARRSPARQKESRFSPNPIHINNGIPDLGEFRKTSIDGVTLARNVQSKVFDWPTEQKQKMQREKDREAEMMATPPPPPSLPATPRRGSVATRRDSITTTRRGSVAIELPPSPPSTFRTPRRSRGSTTPRRQSRDVSHVTDINMTPVPEPKFRPARSRTPPSSRRKKKSAAVPPPPPADQDDLIRKLTKDNEALRESMFRMREEMEGQSQRRQQRDEPQLPYDVLEFIWVPRRQIEAWRKDHRGNELHNKVINTCVRFLSSHNIYEAGIITDTVDDLSFVVDTSSHVEVVQLFNISNKCFAPEEVHPDLLQRVAEHQHAYVSPTRNNVFAHAT